MSIHLVVGHWLVVEVAPNIFSPRAGGIICR